MREPIGLSQSGRGRVRLGLAELLPGEGEHARQVRLDRFQVVRAGVDVALRLCARVVELFGEVGVLGRVGDRVRGAAVDEGVQSLPRDERSVGLELRFQAVEEAEPALDDAEVGDVVERRSPSTRSRPSRARRSRVPRARRPSAACGRRVPGFRRRRFRSGRDPSCASCSSRVRPGSSRRSSAGSCARRSAGRGFPGCRSAGTRSGAGRCRAAGRSQGSARPCGASRAAGTRGTCRDRSARPS